jgi:hypothetical protein
MELLAQSVSVASTAYGASGASEFFERACREQRSVDRAGLRMAQNRGGDVMGIDIRQLGFHEIENTAHELKVFRAENGILEELENIRHGASPRYGRSNRLLFHAAFAYARALRVP